MMYLESMFQHTRTIRTLLVLGLSLSLGVSGIAPTLMTCAAAGTLVPSPVAQKTCCGANQNGACCGMACCRVEAPRPHRTPAPHDHRGDLARALELASFWTVPEIAGNGHSADDVASRELAVTAVRRHTLQALHVLLQT